MWSCNLLGGLSCFAGGYPVWRCVKARQKNVEYPSQPFAVFPLLSGEIFRWILAGMGESKCRNGILTDSRTGKHTSNNYYKFTALHSPVNWLWQCILAILAMSGQPIVCKKWKWKRKKLLRVAKGHHKCNHLVLTILPLGSFSVRFTLRFSCKEKKDSPNGPRLNLLNVEKYLGNLL